MCRFKNYVTLHEYNLAQGLHCPARFDDLDLVKRSEVCQNRILQIMFFFKYRFFPIVV